MMAEIYHRGPIACGVAVTQAFLDYKGGVFKDTTGARDIDHDISLVGYGVTEDGEKYWVLRNSWGEFWGENGYARVLRGNNTIAVETDCAWATPLANSNTQFHTTTD